jgi:hypothetical protein
MVVFFIPVEWQGKPTFPSHFHYPLWDGCGVKPGIEEPQQRQKWKESPKMLDSFSQSMNCDMTNTNDLQRLSSTSETCNPKNTQVQANPY